MHRFGIPRNLVPARFAWFDHHIDWTCKNGLYLGCAGDFIDEALVVKGVHVTGIHPAADAIEAARSWALLMGKKIKYDVGVG